MTDKVIVNVTELPRTEFRAYVQVVSDGPVPRPKIHIACEYDPETRAISTPDRIEVAQGKWIDNPVSHVFRQWQALHDEMIAEAREMRGGM